MEGRQVDFIVNGRLEESCFLPNTDDMEMVQAQVKFIFDKERRLKKEFEQVEVVFN